MLPQPTLARDEKLPYSTWVSFFGLSGGEFSIVAFVTVVVVSARYWPAFGERIAVRVSGIAPEHAAGQKPTSEPPPRE